MAFPVGSKGGGKPSEETQEGWKEELHLGGLVAVI